MARKKQQEPEGGGGGSFVVLFTALSMILLAFFILLYSLSKRDETREKIALGSLVGTFGILPGGIRPDAGTAPSADQYFTVTEPDKIEQMFNDLATKISNVPPSSVRIKQGIEEASVIFQPDYLFKPGSVELSEAAKEALRTMAYFVHKYDVNLQIEGRVAPDESFARERWTVWSLAGARAAVVADFLERDAGVPGRRLRATGVGAYRPRPGEPSNMGVEILMVRPQKT